MEKLGLITLGLIIFAAHFFSALFEKTKIPDILPITIIGIILGPITGLLNPEDLGLMGPLLSSIALILMLFDGGSHLNINTLKTTLLDSANLLASTFIFTTLITCFITYIFLGYSLLASFFIGLILANISPAVVVPLVKLLKISNKTKTMLFVESAISDVLSIIFSLSVLKVIEVGSIDVGKVLGLEMIGSIVLAFIVGAAGAFIWANILNKVREFPNSIFTSLAFLFIIYGLSETLGYNGPITALVFGLIITNSKKLPKDIAKRLGAARIEEFNSMEKTLFSEVIFLVKTFFFVYLGISIQLNSFKILFWGLIITIAIYLGRFFLVKLTVPKTINKNERGLISSIVPKGLATAVLADIPMHMNLPSPIPGAIAIDVWLEIRSLTYAIIFFSIIITGVLIYLKENHLIDDKINQYL